MATLTFDQTAQYAYNSGFRGKALVTMVAIAAGESSLRTDAQNLSDPFGGSWGLVQINGSHFHAGGTSKTCALNPQCALNYAYALSGHGVNFLPWGAYTNGSYTHYLSQATTAANKIKGVNVSMSTNVIPSTSDTSSNPKDTTGSTGSILNFLPGWTDNPVRVLKLAVGVMLIGIALIMLITPEGQAVGQTIGRPVTSGLKTVRSSVKVLAR
jgi:hypothetical protein